MYCLQYSTFLFFLIKNLPIKFYINYCSTDTPVSVAQMGVSDDDLALTTTGTQDRKYLRQTGQSYHSSKGAKISAKEFKYLPCKCVFRCDTNLPEEARQEIFARFWKLGSWDAQTVFIYSVVSEVRI